MTATAKQFAQTISSWQQYQQTPWGQLRYLLGRPHILAKLPPAPAPILDLGGGDGQDALALAELGYEVTLVDYSAEMLSLAQQAAEKAGVAITTIGTTAETVAQVLPHNHFTAVLCHFVLHYVASPLLVLHQINQLLQSEGVLSIIVPNPHANPLRHALVHHQFEQAEAEIGREWEENPELQSRTNTPTAATWHALFAQAGFHNIQQYGLRCVTDYIANNEIKYDPNQFSRLLSLEKALAPRFPYNEIGRFYQFIMHKRS